MNLFNQDYKYASFKARLSAYILDALALMIPIFIVYLLIRGHVPAHEKAIEFIADLFVSWIYYASMESSRFQGTLGKIAFGLKVTDMKGKRISFFRASIRSLGQVISLFILFIGYFMVLWDSRNQALHDKLAGCLVLEQLKEEFY